MTDLRALENHYELIRELGVDFFSTNVELGPNGVEKIHPIGQVTEYEQKLIDVAVGQLKGNISKGVKFVAENP